VHYLLKLVTKLVKAGVLRSLKGPTGGYRLARPARQITLLEVVEAVAGPVRGQAVSASGEGGEVGRRLDAAFDLAAGVVADRFSKVKLSDLAGKRRTG